MGQAGYGIDQAYLWYLRDGLSLDHHVLLFAFIEDDFKRVAQKRFLGYSKPFMVLENGHLLLTPASPQNGPVRRWLSINGYRFRGLKSVDFFRRILRRSEGGVKDWRVETWAVVKTMFDNLAAKHEGCESHMILIFLPDKEAQDRSVDDWCRRLEGYAEQANLHYVDLWEEYRAMVRDQASSLFGPDNEHYGRKGNAWVAKRIANELATLVSNPPRLLVLFLLPLVCY
jgi:hypothetical protein